MFRSSIKTAPFEALLPNTSDPRKAEVRGKLVYVLRSQGEIIPSADSPLGKLWDLINSRESSLEECREIIELDSALATRILRVANSAAFGLNTADISEAVFHIGFAQLREQVFNATVIGQFSAMQVPIGWEFFWLRNIFIARLCEAISINYHSTDGSEYLSGLIHDLGWLFLALHTPVAFTAIAASEASIEEAEQQILPFTHAQISAAIAKRANLPPRAINGIVHHHHPLKLRDGAMLQAGDITLAEDPRFLGVVLKVCDQLADAKGMEFWGHSVPSMEQVLGCPEALLLAELQDIDFPNLVAEELAKSKEIFNIYFSNSR